LGIIRALSPTVKGRLEDAYSDVGIDDITLRQIFEHMDDVYGKLTAADLSLLMRKLVVPYTLQQPFMDWVNEQRKVFKTCKKTGQPISEHQQLDYLIAGVRGLNHSQIDLTLGAFEAEFLRTLSTRKYATLVDRLQAAITTINQLGGAAPVGTLYGAAVHPQPLPVPDEKHVDQAALTKAITEAVMANVLPMLMAAAATGKARDQESPPYYCWSCGHNHSHKGTDCTRRGDGHRPEATASKTLGGSTRTAPPPRKKGKRSHKN
jgi:hypothetical protein